MIQLNNSVLVDICSELAECTVDVQKFTLTGKESFLSYIQVFQSVRGYKISNGKILITLVSMWFCRLKM